MRQRWRARVQRLVAVVAVEMACDDGCDAPRHSHDHTAMHTPTSNARTITVNRRQRGCPPPVRRDHLQDIRARRQPPQAAAAAAVTAACRLTQLHTVTAAAANIVTITCCHGRGWSGHRGSLWLHGDGYALIVEGRLNR